MWVEQVLTRWPSEGKRAGRGHTNKTGALGDHWHAWGVLGWADGRRAVAAGGWWVYVPLG